MDSAVYANTLLLRQHSDDIREERRTAMRLADQLRLARRLAGPTDHGRFEKLIASAENLGNYFHEMAGLVDNMATDFACASRRSGTILEDNLSRNHWEPL